MSKDNTYTLILPASHIPDGTTVTKRTGERPYVLERKIKIYANNMRSNITDTQELIPAPGSVYLLSDGGDAINQYPEDIRLAVHFDRLEHLYDFLAVVQDSD